MQRRYDEIKARSGRLIIQGVEYRATLDDLENICPMGSGSSGHVDKMRYKPTGHIMAVKVCFSYLNILYIIDCVFF